MKTETRRLDELPELTEEQRVRLARVAAMSDAEIDTGDIPELTEAQLAEMERGRFWRPVKEQVTTRIDADVLAWLKASGKGYQSRINAILREAMLRGR
ncbi:MAG: cytoplasmic protein [Rhodovulum sulfidophilum]|uniref:Cytoplasmic protein n=1 Tax=Rhodovulum sulfidophilum TaxID=35806 RepID=A0A2W5MXJ5_RHOSU|nr:MAG: cytoplasmic protein [Rhodovulum sulfidophilum]